MSVDWSTEAVVHKEFAESRPFDFLGFRLGMSLEDVRALIASDSKFSAQELRPSSPSTFKRKSGSDQLSVSLPAFDHILPVVVTTNGTTKDVVDLYFTPESNGQVVYLMNRKSVSDNSSLGREKFWASIDNKFGKTELIRNGTWKSTIAIQNVAEYAWSRSGASRASSGCNWGNYSFDSFDTVRFDVSQYSLDHTEGVERWVNSDCATMVSVVEAGMKESDLVGSFAMIAFDPELYLMSLQQNSSVKDSALDELENGLNKLKESQGKESPEL